MPFCIPDSEFGFFALRKAVSVHSPKPRLKVSLVEQKQNCVFGGDLREHDVLNNHVFTVTTVLQDAKFILYL